MYHFPTKPPIVAHCLLLRAEERTPAPAPAPVPVPQQLLALMSDAPNQPTNPSLSLSSPFPFLCIILTRNRLAFTDLLITPPRVVLPDPIELSPSFTPPQTSFHPAYHTYMRAPRPAHPDPFNLPYLPTLQRDEFPFRLFFPFLWEGGDGEKKGSKGIFPPSRPCRHQNRNPLFSFLPPQRLDEIMTFRFFFLFHIQLKLN